MNGGATVSGNAGLARGEDPNYIRPKVITIRSVSNGYVVSTNSQLGSLNRESAEVIAPDLVQVNRIVTDYFTDTQEG